MYFRFPGAMRMGNGGKVWQTVPHKEFMQYAASFMILARCVTS